MESELEHLAKYALLSLIVTVFVFNLSKRLFRERRLPPGPWGLPIVGYLPFLVLNDWQSVKDAFSKDEILGRPEGLLLEGIFHKALEFILDIATESGNVWKEQRRFAFRTLRDLGFGKQVMESNIKDEINHFLQEIDKQEDELIDLEKLLTPSVSNNICYLVFGRRYDYDDPMRKRMDNILLHFPRLIQVINLLFPSLAKFHRFLGITQSAKTIEDAREFERIVDKEIEHHKQQLNPSDIQNYIDGYLVEMDEREKRNEIGSFKHAILNSNIRMFFVAGSETVKTTLSWLFKMISVRKEVQEKVQKEIDDVVGKERMPSWSDRAQMPYTQAVVNKIQRWASVVPLNLPRNLKLGFRPVVILNDWNSIKEAFSKDEILGRPKEMVVEGLVRYNHSLISESGNSWKEQRRFVFRTLRELGFGKQVMESNIKDEINHFLREIKKREDGLIDFCNLLLPSISNNICYLVFGQRYDYDDPMKKQMDNQLQNSSGVTQVTTFVFPFMLKLGFFLRNSRVVKAIEDVRELENKIDEEIEQHKHKLNTDDVRNYIDGYLVEMNERMKRNKNDSFIRIKTF
ncbi:Cytochrome P450 18a1-like protein [Dinothrombium tinctorium]|uniref:Cytochrome P450 18a1-like protein n=1 Tax=Dinothrombium tinctorium TaxID=1965070 RepID=A0A443QWP1_9ACAR|nr:Cytochrome P450 18a1-like protein [Dinothrombium tinctorium]